MKRVLLSIFISFLLLSALSAAGFTRVKQVLFPVETEVINREATSYFIYSAIDSVVLINSERKMQKTKLKKNEYSYDKTTGKLSFKNPLPYDYCIAQIKGVPSLPYTCYLKDFEGSKEQLLVILDNIPAVEKIDYVYDPKTHLLVFRPDIDISTTSYYMVYYLQTSNGVVSKTISNDFNDTIAELQARHNQELFGGPLVIYKDRTGVSLSNVSKEVGFKINLLPPRSCTIVETYDGTRKSVVVYCSYKNKLVECSEFKTTEYRK